MARALLSYVFFLLVAPSASVSQQSLHVYYYNGECIEQLNIDGIAVSVTFKDLGKINQTAVYVANDSSDAVNVIPSNFGLHQNSPNDEDLAVRSPQEIEKTIGRRPFLGQVATGVGAELSHAKDKITGKEKTPSAIIPPGYEARAQYLAHANELAEHGQISALAHLYLRGSTVFPNTQLAGILWFDRHEAFASGELRVTLGRRHYAFPFPPPEWATTPSTPDLTTDGTNSADQRSSAQQNASESSPSNAGVLGISGETWNENGVEGVKILEVTPSGSAELAGLYAGCLITEVDAVRIHSTQDLTKVLSQRGPGTRVSITYLINTKLGWMPKVGAVILGR